MPRDATTRLGRLGRFFRRPSADHLLFVEATILLSWTRLLLLAIPFRRIAPKLGRTMAETPLASTEAEIELVRRVSWAIQAAARHVPLGFVCLPQAIAAKWMLRRRGVPSTLYLGLSRNDETELSAHAWLRVGNRIVTGRGESLSHTVVASYAESGVTQFPSV